MIVHGASFDAFQPRSSKDDVRGTCGCSVDDDDEFIAFLARLSDDEEPIESGSPQLSPHTAPLASHSSDTRLRPIQEFPPSVFESAQERALNGLYSTPWEFGGSGAQGGSYASYTHAASPGVSTCIPTSPHSRSGLLNYSDGPGVDQDMCGPGDVLLAGAGPGPVEVLGGHLRGCGHQGPGHLPATSPTAGGESHPFGVFNKPAAGSPAAGGVRSHPLRVFSAPERRSPPVGAVDSQWRSVEMLYAGAATQSVTLHDATENLKGLVQSPNAPEATARAAHSTQPPNALSGGPRDLSLMSPSVNVALRGGARPSPPPPPPLETVAPAAALPFAQEGAPMVTGGGQEQGCGFRETKQERSARLKKERDRRSQAALRERCRVQIKELQDKHQGTMDKLRAQQGRLRRLQGERTALMQRVRTLTDADPAAHPGCAAHGPPASSQQSGAQHSSASMESGHACSSQDHDVVASKHRRRGGHTFCAGYSRRPISSFKHSAAVSYAHVERFVLERKLRHTCRFDFIKQAIEEYQREVAQSQRVAVTDICWFLQTTFPLNGNFLSYSSGAHSPECALSSSFAYATSIFESMLLVAEHENLREACSDASASCMEPPLLELDTMQDRGRPLFTPQPPDAAVLCRMRVRCGVNKTSPLSDAVVKVLKPMMLRHRTLLPRAQWKAVCMKAMLAFQATVDELSKKCPPPKARSTAGAAYAVPPPTVPTGHGTVATSTPSMRYQDLAQGLLCMHQLILCTMHDVLSEPPAVTEAVPMGGQSRSLLQVQSRMHELNASMGLCAHMYMICAPTVCRKVLAAQFLGPRYHTAQGQRLQMKMYKHLQLQPDQRAALADRWRSWCRRRHHLDCALNDGVLKLQNLLETSQNIPLAALKLATLAEHSTQHTAPPARGADIFHEPKDHRNMHGGHALTGSAPGPTMHDVWAEAHSRQAPPAGGAAGGALQGARCFSGSTSIQDEKSGVSDGESSFMFALSVLSAATNMVVDVNLTSCADSHNSTDAAASTLRSAAMLAAPSDAADTCSMRADAMHDRHALHGHAHTRSEQGSGTMHSGSIPSGPLLSGPLDGMSTHSGWGGYRGVQGSPWSKSPSMSCDGCSFKGAQRQLSGEGFGGDWQPRAWVPCIGCGSGRWVEGRLLGECGEMVQAARDALHAITDVSESDGLMHFEFLAPFWELNEVQHAKLTGSQVSMGVPCPEMMQLFRTAAAEERRESLFSGMGEFGL